MADIDCGSACVCRISISSQTTNATKAPIRWFASSKGLIDQPTGLQLGALCYTDARYTDGTANLPRARHLSRKYRLRPDHPGAYGDTPRGSSSFFLRFPRHLANAMGEACLPGDAFLANRFYSTHTSPKAKPFALTPNTRSGVIRLGNARIDWTTLLDRKVDVRAYV